MAINLFAVTHYGTFCASSQFCRMAQFGKDRNRELTPIDDGIGSYQDHAPDKDTVPGLRPSVAMRAGDCRNDWW